MKIRIFFSGQSVTNETFNKNPILAGIQKAVKNLTKMTDLKDIDFEVIDGSKGTPGSSHVAETIQSCDIFIADLSVINSIRPFRKFIKRITGNKFIPLQDKHVRDEYEIAIKALGPEKIITIVNEALGSPNGNPENVPFDLAQIRFPLPYRYSESTKNKVKAEIDLTAYLSSLIRVNVAVAARNKGSQDANAYGLEK